jgi:hypothetical protein
LFTIFGSKGREWGMGMGKVGQGLKVRVDGGVHNADGANVETQAVTWHLPISSFFSAKINTTVMYCIIGTVAGLHEG